MRSRATPRSPGSEPEGQRLFLNAPLPEPVFEATDRRYPTFNLGIPDQFRVEEFERDFKLKLAAGKVPALIVIRLPNDHTADPRPADGYPYRASYVADNDLALGRIVAFLSKTPIWKDSAFFVTEDDAQNGVDHVDAHRSILLVASPWVKPGSVSHEHTSMGSITRTIDELLGLGPLNLEDALAGEITGIFDTQPHLRALHRRARRPARLRCRRKPALPSPRQKKKPQNCATWTTPTRFARRWKNLPENCASRRTTTSGRCGAGFVVPAPEIVGAGLVQLS